MAYRPVIGEFVQIPASSGGAQTLAQTLALGNDANALNIVNLADPVGQQDALTFNYWQNNSAPTCTNAFNDQLGNSIKDTYATTAFLNASIPLATILAAAGITPIADGTYTVGLGVTTNGTITTQNGIIVGIQQAS